MNNYCCDHLDDYLDDDLDIDQLARFNKSVIECADCKRILEQQNRLDQQLRAGWEEQPVPSFTTAEAFDARVEPKSSGGATASSRSSSPSDDASHRGAAIAVSLIATIAILAAVLVRTPQDVNGVSGDSIGGAKTRPAVSQETVEPTPPAIVEFDSRAVGVVDEISDDSFTLVHVYPTINVVQQSKR